MKFSLLSLVPASMIRSLQLAPDDLLRGATYRRLWTSILISSFGGQVTMLALPLTAAVLLHATPTQMGLLTAVEVAPFVLFSLPSGVWLDRVRKLPVYIGGELLLAVVVASVPLAWWLGVLSMSWMYVVGFALGTVYTIAGSAAQIVLTQVVPRERLVEAHAKNALASSSAEVAGPAAAGALIKLAGAPLALLADAVLLVVSTSILRGIRVTEQPRHVAAAFWPALREGLDFVWKHRLLVTMAALVGVWQMCHHAALVVQILFATRTLGLTEGGVGLCFVGLGFGTIAASAFGHRISRRFGPGPTLVLGFAICGVGWSLGALAPASSVGIALFAAMLCMFGVGAVLIFITFLSLRQAVTPAPLLGRMTSTMRWLILLPAGPGALIGGWLGEHVGLRASLAFAGGGALLLALLADAVLLVVSTSILRGIRVTEQPRHVAAAFWPALREGLDFVWKHRLLVTMAALVGVWQMCHHAALVVQILFATRTLGLTEGGVGLCFVGLGFGTIAASAVGHRISRRFGPGPTLVLGFAICGVGWSLGALAPASSVGIALFAAMLCMFGVGAVLIFITFLSLRQAVTPVPLLGRMTSTMRWLILLPAGPGALIGGWLGEHVGLRASLGFAGGGALLLALLAWRQTVIRTTRSLPQIDSDLAPAH